jgi:predicted RNase H-like HicB family nuclease
MTASGVAVPKRLVFSAVLVDSFPMEIVFTVTQEGDGGYVAECLSHDIFTQGNTWEELRSNVREAVSAYFFDRPKPAVVRLHLVRDELLTDA